ncbi:ARI5A protein, partial [Urocolius indicus]|nr:ARI5A protein [Urocolius indicus]
MSPLAKKKLLAQVSKAESLPSPKCHGPGSEPPPRPLPSPRLRAGRSPEAALQPAPRRRGELGPSPGVAEEGAPVPKEEEDEDPRLRAAEDGALAPAPGTRSGCFHTYRPAGPRPPGSSRLCGCLSSSKDFLEPSSTFFSSSSRELQRPQDLRREGGEGQSPRGCWLPTAAAKRCWGDAEEEKEEEDEEEEEAALGPASKLQAVSPWLKEGRDSSGRGRPGVAKPRAVVASPGYSPAVYKGVMLQLPFGSTLEHLQSQGVPGVPALSLNPFIIPAFPSPLVAASAPAQPCPGLAPLCCQSSARQRLCHGSAWHSHSGFSSLPAPSCRHHPKL